MARQRTVAQVIVDRGGFRGLARQMELVVLWSLALAKNPEMSVNDVQRFGERTSWGSDAKFYRLLKEWRALTGTESPSLVVAAMSERKNHARMMGELFAVPASRVGVV